MHNYWQGFLGLPIRCIMEFYISHISAYMGNKNESLIYQVCCMSDGSSYVDLRRYWNIFFFSHCSAKTLCSQLPRQIAKQIIVLSMTLTYTAENRERLKKKKMHLIPRYPDPDF